MVIEEVRDERSSQDAKWGFQDHHPNKWMVILMEEVGEVAANCRDAYPFLNPKSLEERMVLLSKYRKELIQVAAVAVAAVESLDQGFHFLKEGG